jgi:hypothetical protein
LKLKGKEDKRHQRQTRKGRGGRINGEKEIREAETGKGKERDGRGTGSGEEGVAKDKRQLIVKKNKYKKKEGS